MMPGIHARLSLLAALSLASCSDDGHESGGSSTSTGSNTSSSGSTVASTMGLTSTGEVFSRTAPLMFDELTIYASDGLGGFGAPQSFMLHSGMVDMDDADFDGDTLTEP